MPEIVVAVLSALSLILEVVGAAIVAMAAAAMLFRVGREVVRRQRIHWRSSHRGLGRGLVLGLDFMIGADVIRTITAPELEELIGLAAIIILRSILALSIEAEMRLEPPETGTSGSGLIQPPASPSERKTRNATRSFTSSVVSSRR